MPKKKRTKKPPKSKEIIGDHKKFTPGVCIICGASVEKKRDKRKRMYVRCALCGTMMFLSTINSEIGYQIIENMVSQNVPGFQNEIQIRLAEIHQEQAKQIQKKSKDKEMSLIDKELGLKFPKI